MKYIIITVMMYVVSNILCMTPVNNTIAKYDPAELLMNIFNIKEIAMPRANFDKIQFENQIRQPDNRNIQYEAQFNQKENSKDNLFRYEDNVFENDNKNENNVVKFEDSPNKSKKRRKRRPRQHYYGLQNPAFAPSGGNHIPYPSFGAQYYRPPRAEPSLASEALTAVTEALTSIAMYDDYQCVPRLLCEAAAGGALGESGILQTVSRLQPLLTLLSAYNGLTNNPLFVFGGAVILGASSNGNPASCRYAYSSCPTDPEQLVHYLNNHNGGFFRFFNAPQQGQQNIEQFYNQLSQNYGLYQPHQDYNQIDNQQNYGFYNSMQQQNSGFYKPGLYSNQVQNYGLAHPYIDNAQNIRFKDNDHISENTYHIEKRIQNKPTTIYIEDYEDDNTKWKFPGTSENSPVNYVNNDVFESYSSNNDNNFNINDNRKGKGLKFPGLDEDEDYLQTNFDRRVRGFSFPEHQSNRQYTDYNYNPNYNINNKYVDRDIYANKYNINEDTYDYNNNDYKDAQEGIRTVYVVRGNSDPNKPEIYKLRPGQSVE